MAGKEDAEALRKAMKGWGTNEGALIDIIGTKTNAELCAVHAAYTEHIERDLIKDIKDETGSDFEKTLIDLITFSGATDAHICMAAMKGLGTDEDLLTEVLCTRSPTEIEACKEMYNTEYKKDLITDVEDEVSGNLGKLYSLLLTEERKEAGDVDEDVEKLYSAGEDKMGTNEGVFIRLLGGVPREHCEAIYFAYAKKYGKALDEVIIDEMGGKLGRALAALVTPCALYYANSLKRSMAGIGTDDSSLIRLIVTQKERNLAGACKRYLADNKETVAKSVEDECSGDYKRLLLKVLETFGVAE